MQDYFKTRAVFDIGDGKQGTLYSLPMLERNGIGTVSRLPVCLRIILEALLRNCDGQQVTETHVRELAAWQPQGKRIAEIPFRVGRIILHDVAGIPALGDLAAMRSAAARLGREPKLIDPRVPVIMVVDHTIDVDYHDSPDAMEKNMRLEIERNEERFRFVKWAAGALHNFRIIPPGYGIMHQINLEYMARGLLSKDGVYYPDTLVGSDSHTVTVNGIGIVAWGVGGIEATAAMLGQPIYLLAPDVIGVHVQGRLREGVTTTDAVLTLNETLRKAGVVGSFVEFFGDGARDLPVSDRATLANMAPEYGASIAFFPPDEELCTFFGATGRTEREVETFRNYYRAQHMFGIPAAGEIDYTRVVEFNLSEIAPCVAGPKRPQDRIELGRVKERFAQCLTMPVSEGGYGKKRTLQSGAASDVPAIDHGSILIAGITSCTNTVNPSVMIAAGLVAKKAVERGLTRKPWVKTSLAPGSRVVSHYLDKTGLQPYLDALGFQLVGYGCLTCDGASGPLIPPFESQVAARDLIGVAVHSGNRNFESRIHPSLKATFLMSPPLVVAYALTGRIDVDLATEPLGRGKDGSAVYLKDIWPTAAEVATLLPAAFEPEAFRRLYGDFTENILWNEILTPRGDIYPWDCHSLYVQEPPFFNGVTPVPPGLRDIAKARALALLGDTISTDHISPCTTILPNSPAGQYLQSLGVKPVDFNFYGSRRMFHTVMMRGTFANPRLRNLMLPGTEGGISKHMPSGTQESIYDVAMRYKEEGVPLIVFAGHDYGMGSARDWAVKGTSLLGIRAVVARSFEKIHRTSLVCLGVVPCQFAENTTIQSLKLDGTETFDLLGLDDNAQPRQSITLRITRTGGMSTDVPLVFRADTPMEVEYLRHGGILPYLLRSFLGSDHGA